MGRNAEDQLGRDGIGEEIGDVEFGDILVADLHVAGQASAAGGKIAAFIGHDADDTGADLPGIVVSLCGGRHHGREAGKQKKAEY